MLKGNLTEALRAFRRGFRRGFRPDERHAAGDGHVVDIRARMISREEEDILRHMMTFGTLVRRSDKLARAIVRVARSGLFAPPVAADIAELLNGAMTDAEALLQLHERGSAPPRTERPKQRRV